MKQLTLDFSLAGYKDAIREFGLSLFKTILAAGIVFVLDRLSTYQLPADTAAEYVSLYTIAVAAVRALLTSVWVWATKTSASVVPVEQATSVVEEVPVDTNTQPVG